MVKLGTWSLPFPSLSRSPAAELSVGSFWFLLFRSLCTVYVRISAVSLFAIARSYRLQRLWCMAMFKTVLNGINVYTAFENHPFEVVFGEFPSI